MSALLTREETTHAASMGWGVHHVYDLASSRWRVMILGGNDSVQAGRLVVQLARGGNTLAQKALGLVLKSNQEK